MAGCLLHDPEGDVVALSGGHHLVGQHYVTYVAVARTTAHAVSAVAPPGDHANLTRRRVQAPVGEVFEVRKIARVAHRVPGVGVGVVGAVVGTLKSLRSRMTVIGCYFGKTLNRSYIQRSFFRSL